VVGVFCIAFWRGVGFCLSSLLLYLFITRNLRQNLLAFISDMLSSSKPFLLSMYTPVSIDVQFEE
jgi:hypothetical protein